MAARRGPVHGTRRIPQCSMVGAHIAAAGLSQSQAARVSAIGRSAADPASRLGVIDLVIELD